MTIILGMIGYGRHAKHHAKNCNDFVIQGVWDPYIKPTEQIPGVRFATLEKLLADDKIEAVMIATRDEFHLDQIEMALEAGKHVFCEKPLLVPGQDISRLEAAFNVAELKGLVLTSCHPRRYDRPICWLLDRVSFKINHPEFIYRFGKVVSFCFDFSYHTPTNEWKTSRSLLLDHVNHEVDLMNALFGIQGFTAWKLSDGFNHYLVVGNRDDDISFFLQGTRCLKEQNYPEWCRIRFERGEVALDMMMGLGYVSDHEKKTLEIIPNLAIDYDGRLEGVMNDFAGAISGEYSGYLSREEMLMNSEAGIVLQNEGIQRVAIRASGLVSKVLQN